MAALRFPVSSILFNHLEGLASSGNHVNGDDMRIMSSSNNLNNSSNIRDFPESASSSYAAAAITTSFSMAYLPQTLVLCELRHDGFEERVSSGPSNSGLIAKWWPRDRVSAFSPLSLYSVCQCVSFAFLVFKYRTLYFPRLV